MKPCWRSVKLSSRKQEREGGKRERRMRVAEGWRSV